MSIKFKRYYRIKYSLLEILGHFYISPSGFVKKFIALKKDESKYKSCGTQQQKTQKKFGNKKIIAVIDNYVPEYDLHAGARTLFQYMKLYADMGFDVKFIPDDFIRREPYAGELESYGIEVLCGCGFKARYENWFIENSKNIIFVMLNRPRSIKYIDFLKKYTDVKIAYYGMDMYFVREYNRYLTSAKKDALRASKFYKLIETRLYKQSDVVLTISKKEKLELEKLIPSEKIYEIPCFLYKDFPVIKYAADSRADLLFVGGEKHRPNKDALIWFINEILPRIPEKIKLNIAGLYGSSFINSLTNSRVIFKGPVSDAELKDLYLSSKIAVIPLLYGAGVKGKTVEAMYYGLPAVSTGFGIEGLSDIDGIISKADNSGDFAKAVTELYDDAQKLVDRSAKASEYIKNNFSYDNAMKKIEQLVKKLS